MYRSLGLNKGRGMVLNFLGGHMILYHKKCISSGVWELALAQ
jgi:hypothetical protein